MQTAQLIYGKIKYQAGTPRDTQYGPRINVVVSLPNGEETKLWGNPGDSIQYLKKGETVALAHDGKSYTLIATPETNGNQAPTTQTQAPRPPAPTPETRETMGNLSADVKEWLSIYAEFEQARPDLSEQCRRTATTTLFMKRCEIRQEFSKEEF